MVAGTKELVRIADEEAMLSAHFSKATWAAHVTTKWRLFPGDQLVFGR